ncbi:hypothetical protein [Actinoplanes philippinensis]|uniref:hypothetical protein n=1 Tax=Actinoplanes philippinensis TaxID=35752 RepID=UPI0033FE49D1
MTDEESPRRQLRVLPWPVAVPCAGMLTNAAATVRDLAHRGESFHYGDSPNGAVAYLLEGGFAWLRLVGTVVLAPVLWVTARRAHRPGSRAAGVALRAAVSWSRVR